MGRVVVVGLGPAGPEMVTAATLDAIARTPVRFVRTWRHPSSSLVVGADSFDSVYDEAATMDEVYTTIVERLTSAAARHGEVLYAVPGSPRVAERSVELLVAQAKTGGEVAIEPALSFLDLAWDRLGIDPLAEGVRLVDGHRFAVQAAGERGPLLVGQCDSVAVLSGIKLSVGEGAVPKGVTVLQRLGLPDESLRQVAWDELDRVVEPDHLTTVWIPQLAAPVGAELVQFAELVRTLRERCPWDRKQTHRSLTGHLLEETYEVLEAIEALDPTVGSGYGALEEELGDLLFQVVFHSTLGAEAGQFTLADVARTVHDKLVRRHPHVFADVIVSGADEVVRNWEEIKRDEKGRTSVMEGIPRNLPALLYALKVLRKAASAGLSPPAVTHLDLGSVEDERTLGEAIFVLVNVALRLHLDPEAALRSSTARFVAGGAAEPT